MVKIFSVEQFLKITNANKEVYKRLVRIKQQRSTRRSLNKNQWSADDKTIEKLVMLSNQFCSCIIKDSVNIV